MEKNDLPKKIKNFLKNNINNLVNNNELKLDKNSHELFLKIIIDNINNEKIIKYIIKIISFNIKYLKIKIFKKNLMLYFCC